VRTPAGPAVTEEDNALARRRTPERGSVIIEGARDRVSYRQEKKVETENSWRTLEITSLWERKREIQTNPTIREYPFFCTVP
jgi:hypothetical protein